MVAVLRAEAGRNPYDRAPTDLIGELSTRSQEFRTRWAAHDVRFHRTGSKQLHHPVVADLDLTYEAMELPADPRPDAARLHRRARHALSRRTEPPAQLGGNQRPCRCHARRHQGRLRRFRLPPWSPAERGDGGRRPG
jgi:hypothetical protein